MQSIIIGGTYITTNLMNSILLKDKYSILLLKNIISLNQITRNKVFVFHMIFEILTVVEMKIFSSGL
jgi:hypothetical protein